MHKQQKINKKIALIGMMGSGKSTIGYILSKKLNLRFVDIDKKIENSENNSILEIFETKGEEYFRKIEEKITIREFNKNEEAVISIGGGSFLNKKTRNTILKKSISFWLNWKSETIIERIKNSKKRPIANKLDVYEIKELINFRAKTYVKSNFKINCENLSKNQIVKKILNIYENKKNKSKNETTQIFNNYWQKFN